MAGARLGVLSAIENEYGKVQSYPFPKCEYIYIPEKSAIIDQGSGKHSSALDCRERESLIINSRIDG